MGIVKTIGLGLLGCMLGVACEDPRVEARLRIGQLGLEFSSEVLIDRVQKQDLVAVELLLKAGMPPAVTDAKGIPAWRWAIERGNLEVVRYLLHSGLDPYHAFDDHPDLVSYAVASDNGKLLQLLIDQGMDLNRVLANGLTPIHLAADQGSIKAIEVLLQAGLDSFALTADGWSSLMFSARAGTVDTAQRVLTHLVDRGIKGNGQALAAVPSAARVRALVNHSDRQGFTALHIAARDGHLNMVKLLVTAGAEIDVRNEQGRTPLFFAAQRGHLAIAEVLSNVGADILKKSAGSESPYHAAVNAGHADVAALFYPEVDRACRQGGGEWCFAVGERTLEQGNLDEAYGFFRKSCDGGHFAACWNAGQLAKRFGDHHQIEILQRRGCDHGVAKSCNSLAVLLGKKGEVQQALSFYEKACQWEDALGCANLGKYFGRIKKDRARAAELYRKACTFGQESACLKSEEFSANAEEIVARIDAILLQKASTSKNYDKRLDEVSVALSHLNHLESFFSDLARRVGAAEKKTRAQKELNDLRWAQRSEKAFRLRTAAEAAAEWQSFTTHTVAQINAVTTWSCTYARTEAHKIDGRIFNRSLCFLDQDRRMGVYLDGGPKSSHKPQFGGKISLVWKGLGDVMPGAKIVFTGQFKAKDSPNAIFLKPLRMQSVLSLAH